MRRLGQLQMLVQVNIAQEAARATIRRQLQQGLHSSCCCDVVPGVRANLNHPWVLKKLAKAIAAILEQHRLAKAKQRHDGWHEWLAEQKRVGGRHVFEWLKWDETRWAPAPWASNGN